MEGVGTTISSQSLSLVYDILWASGTGNLVLGIKTQKICCCSISSPLGSPLFLSTGQSYLQSPTTNSLGNFTAWSAGRVPVWWSGAYVRGPAAIKSGNCGSIKHGYESWGSLLCLVVSGGGSKQNRSCLGGSILGEAIWKCRFFRKITFVVKQQ